MIGVMATDGGSFVSDSRTLTVGADRTPFMIFAYAYKGSSTEITADRADITASSLLKSFGSDSFASLEAGSARVDGAVESVEGGKTVLSFSEGSWVGYANNGKNDNYDLGNIEVKLGSANKDNGSDAVWYVSKSSSLNRLELQNGGTLCFTAPDIALDRLQAVQAGFHTVETETLVGQNGTLVFRMDLAEDSSALANDQLIVSGQAIGQHQVVIDFGDSLQKVDLEKTHSLHWLVSQGESSDLTLTNTQSGNVFYNNGQLAQWKLGFVSQEDLDAGQLEDEDFRNSMTNTGTGEGYWYLYQSGTDGSSELPPESEQIKNLGSSVAQAIGWLSEKNDLRRRLGEVRYGSQTGAWAKVFTRQDRANGFAYNGFKQNTNGVHIGYDTFASKSESSSWLVGATLRYARADQEGIETAYGGNGKTNEYSGKLYATWMHEKGSYLDALVQVGYYDQEIRGCNNSGTGSFDADYHNIGMGASVEIGHMFTLSNGADDRRWFNHWFIEPQLELSYFYVKGRDFKTSTGLRVEQGDADFLTGRAGFVIGKKFNYGTPDDLDRRYFQIGVIGGVNHEFLGDQEIRFVGTDGVSTTVDGHGLGGTSFYYGLTADWQVSDRVRFYAELDREEGEHYTKDYGINVGFKYSFD